MDIHMSMGYYKRLIVVRVITVSPQPTQLAQTKEGKRRRVKVYEQLRWQPDHLVRFHG